MRNPEEVTPLEPLPKLVAGGREPQPRAGQGGAGPAPLRRNRRRHSAPPLRRSLARPRRAADGRAFSSEIVRWRT